MTIERRPFPWQAAMAFGFGQMRLSPDQFWSMTPLELAMAMRARRYGSSQPLSRAELASLMARFPDQPGNSKEACPADG